MTAVNPMLVVLRGLRGPWRRALRLWDHVSIYLPLLLMGALALGTYWLVRNSPINDGPDVAKEVKHESDYYMRKFTIKTFDETGKLKSEIYGIEARHYPDTDTLEIDAARIRSINAQGHLVTSTGNRALSNGDGSEVQLMGNARVIREATKDADGDELPRMEFQGEFLHAYVNEERVKSHKPVVLIRGGDQFTGDTFAFNNITGIADLNGRVKGLLVPRVSVPVPSRR
ncbi:MAG: LPS export ABC transporter periplasmic protein LptC [Pseudomonadota bacterium]